MVTLIGQIIDVAWALAKLALVGTIIGLIFFIPLNEYFTRKEQKENI